MQVWLMSNQVWQGKQVPSLPICRHWMVVRSDSLSVLNPCWFKGRCYATWVYVIASSLGVWGLPTKGRYDNIWLMLLSVQMH